MKSPKDWKHYQLTQYKNNNNMEQPSYKKGNAAMSPLIVTAIGTVIASAIGAWATSSQAINKIDTKVQVVEERENNHYLEVSEKLEDIDNKLDMIIKNTK